MTNVSVLSALSFILDIHGINKKGQFIGQGKKKKRETEIGVQVFVYTWRPKLLALQWWIPSSTEFILITGSTGPNGSSHAILISGRT